MRLVCYNVFFNDKHRLCRLYAAPRRKLWLNGDYGYEAFKIADYELQHPILKHSRKARKRGIT